MKISECKIHTLPAIIIVLASLSYCPVSGSFGAEDVIPVASGTSVTVYEQTGSIYEYTYPVFSLLAGGGEFITGAGEKYKITSDGTYLAVHCFHHKSVLDRGEELYAGGRISNLPFRKRIGCRPGNNIVAVKLDGVPGFPEGLWASSVISYSLGENGIAAAKDNTLGDVIIEEDGEGSYCAALGEGNSNIVLGFSSLIRARLTMVPEILKPERDVVTAYIELPEGHRAEEIDFWTAKISEVSGTPANIIPVAWSLEIVNYDNNNLSDFRMDFYTSDLSELLSPGDNSLTVTGRMNDGISFRGSTVVRMPELTP